MADHPEVIRQQMEDTRSQLADKLEKLENHVSDTVQSTTEAVTDTVEAVKETVENVTGTVKETVEKATETVQAVGEALDLRLQTERHPWVIFGGSVVLGFTVAQVLPGSRARASAESHDRARPSQLPGEEASAANGMGHQAAQTSPEPQKEGQKSWFWDQLGRLKGLAIGSLMGVARHLVQQNLPGALGQRVAEEVDSLTGHLGGEPIHGSLFSRENTTPPPQRKSEEANRADAV